MKKIVLSFTCSAAFVLLFAGVMRDDVSEEAYLSLGRQKQFDCVGRVFNGDKAVGSCVLIGKRYVLSAAHVFMSYVTKPDSALFKAQRLILFPAVAARPVAVTACRFDLGGKSYRGKAIKVYGDYTWRTQAMDLALIELDSEVTGVTPAAVNTRLDELGAEITGVGYGASGFGGQPQTVVPQGRKIAGQNMVDSLGGQPLNGLPSTLICDFDSPAKPELNRIGSAVPLPLEYSCSGGDSGGGMFRQRAGRWELVGICHGQEAGINTLMKNGYYGLLMEFTRVSVFSEWIKQNS